MIGIISVTPLEIFGDYRIKKDEESEPLTAEDIEKTDGDILFKTNVNEFKPKKHGRPLPPCMIRKHTYTPHHVTFRDDIWALIKQLSNNHKKNESEVIHTLLVNGMENLQRKITNAYNDL